MSSVELKASAEEKMSMYEGMVEDLVNSDENSRYMLDDLQLAAELGKTLLERNKDLETLLRTHQRKCEDQRLEIEYLTKQNVALRECNDSRLRIYETLDISIQDLEHEKHRLMVENSHDKKLIKSLNQTIESLELRCDELSKQVEEVTSCLDNQRRRNEKIREDTVSSTTRASSTFKIPTLRHIPGDGSASEPETEEASNTTIPSRVFTNNSSILQTSSTMSQLTFMDYSQDLSSIQPIYSLDSLSHDSGFKTESSSNSAEHDALLELKKDFKDMKKKFDNEHANVTDLEKELSILSKENLKLQSELAKANTRDEMKTVHEQLSWFDEIRQDENKPEMCIRCMNKFEDRMVPTENTSYIGTEDDDDRSLMDLVTYTEIHPNYKSNSSPQTTYMSAVEIKDDETLSQPENMSEMDTTQYNPYKELVEKYEALLEVQRGTRVKQQPQQMSLQDELLNSGDFSSFNTKSSSGARHKTPTDFSELETSSSGFSDETSTKATQTEGNPGSFLFSIADGEDCKFTIYDDASPIDSRFRDRPKYRELFKEIFTVLKKAAENKDEGEKLPLLEDDKQAVSEPSKVPPVTPATEDPPCDFDSQSIMSSAMSENSVAISECITKTERKKVKSHKKQAAKDELENKPPVVQMVGGKLVTPYNRLALDLMALNAKKKARRSRHRSRDKYLGRDSSACSNASSTMNQSIPEDHPEMEPTEIETEEGAGESSTLTRNKKGRRQHRELFQTFSTLSTAEWNGDSITVYNRNAKSSNPPAFYCRPNADNANEIKFKLSAASHELKKLKKLDLSYAEVLRQSDKRHRRWK